MKKILIVVFLLLLTSPVFSQPISFYSSGGGINFSPSATGNLICSSDGVHWTACSGSANTIYGTNPSGVSGWYGNWSFDDSAALIFNQTDTTKKIKFNASNVGTGQTRTITMPDADVTLGGTGGETVSVVTGDTTLVSNYTYLVNAGGAANLSLPTSSAGGGPITIRNITAQKIDLVPHVAGDQIETAIGTLNTAGSKVACTGVTCSARLYSVSGKWLFALLNGTWADDGAVDFTAPTLTSATIPAAGTTISLLHSETVNIGVGGNGGWTLTVTPSATMAYASGSGSNTLVYNLNRTVATGESLTISYAQPGNGVEDTNGNDLASISNAAVTNNSTYASCTGFLICQNFETATTGYDNSESWTESVPSGATVSPIDTTATILRGTQQLKIIGGSAAVASTYHDWASGKTEAWAHFLFKTPDATPAQASMIFAFRSSSGSNTGTVVLRSNAVLRVQQGSGTAVDTVSTLSDNTAYRIFVHWVKSTGANDGIMEVEFTNTATTSPSWAGNAYAICNTGNVTSNTQQAFVSSAAGGMTNYWDYILVDDAAITNVPD